MGSQIVSRSGFGCGKEQGMRFSYFNRDWLECMESRLLFSQMTLTVSNTGDSGPGSLRQALLTANGHLNSTAKIVFGLPNASLLQNIAPLSPLR